MAAATADRPSAAPRSTGWTVVIAYAAVVATTQMLWLTFAPIDTDVARDYGVSKNAVGWLAQVFPLLYVLLALPAGVALDRWFRGSLLAGAGLTALGGLLRLVAQTFLWAMIGQVVVAIAQPLVLNALTKTATGYLPERSRPAGIAVGSAGQFVGAIVALAMGPLLEGHRTLGALLPVQAALAVVAAVVLAVVLRRAPPAGQAPRAAIGADELRAVWGIKLTRTLAWLAFVGIGVFVALSTWLQPILDNDHISSTAAGAMLAGMLVAGTIGCGLVPPRVAHRGIERAYLLLVVFWVGGCCALLAVVHATTVADFVVIAALGFVLLAALPVMLELIERRMGAHGGVATGILLLAGNAGGLIVAVIVDLAVNTPAAAFLILAVVALLGLPAARRLAPRAADRV
ncbi:MAG TPA: MFS transporter [Solirubrobacteraceae bacterium]|nr:MFS transporter [Solirubrobacteraceae bacterium]